MPAHVDRLSIAASLDGLSPDAAACVDEPVPASVCWTACGRHVALFEGRGTAGPDETEAANVSLFGVRVNTRNRGAQFPSFLNGLLLFDAPDYAPRRIPLDDASIAPIGFSPDARVLALLRMPADAIELVWVDVDTGRVATVAGHAINGTSSIVGCPPCGWMADSRTMWCRLAVEPGSVPDWRDAPTVMDTAVHRAQAHRLFINKHSAEDERLADLYCTSQLALVDVRSGAVRAIGSRGLFRNVRPSPDGAYLMAERCLLPYGDAPSLAGMPAIVELWDVERNVVLWTSQPQARSGGAKTVSEHWRWDPFQPATLVWSTRRQGGDAIVALAAPFDGPPAVLFQTAGRCRHLAWTADGRYLTWEHAGVDVPGVVRARSRDGAECCLAWEEAPGTVWWPFTTAQDSFVLAQHEDGVFVRGTDGSDVMPQVVVDRIEIGSGRRSRVFASEQATYENPVAMLGTNPPRLLTVAEAPRRPPRHAILDPGTAERRWLTQDSPPTCIARATRTPIRYRGSFGPLNTTMYTPEGAGDAPLPAVLWLYPQVRGIAPQGLGVVPIHRGSLNRYAPYQRFWCHPLPLLAHGYAVVETSALAIDPATDGVIEQLIASASSLLEALEQTGRVDTSRVAIGGHCGGAWASALLMAHSTLFRTAILLSGFFNLMEQPMQQLLPGAKIWVDPKKFFDLSPVTSVQTIRQPILIVNGALDPPEVWGEGEDLYAAVALAGGVARYVVLPRDGHTVLQRESFHLLLAEMARWCGLHLGPLAEGAHAAPAAVGAPIAL